MKKIDTQEARKYVAELTKAIESMDFAAPEAMSAHQDRAADALTRVAKALGLTGQST